MKSYIFKIFISYNFTVNNYIINSCFAAGASCLYYFGISKDCYFTHTSCEIYIVDLTEK